ncbi:MAG: transferrin-binding protein-like solute binding protein, partial [Neisseriaceae bacterium]|nr:transferrin-binding protein-like solute binding protein [Neisseriaceae bacterium]
GYGEFAGTNAAEMAGEFSQRDANNHKNDIYGTFGAKKQ